jgi:hypothetical protein
MFETETMAELCVKQGLVTEALAIYRRLVEAAGDAATRERLSARLEAVERMAGSAARALGGGPAGFRSRPPSLRPAEPGDARTDDAAALEIARDGDTLRVTWALPAGTTAPALQLLLLTRGPEGIEAETRTLALEAVSGAMTIVVPRLYAVRAAAGALDGTRFVPLARLSP